MQSKRETVVFAAYDVSSNRFAIIAERALSPSAGINRKSPWMFRTADWRQVRRAGPPGCYTIDPDNVPLTTSDPNEPQD